MVELTGCLSCVVVVWMYLLGVCDDTVILVWLNLLGICHDSDGGMIELTGCLR